MWFWKKDDKKEEFKHPTISLQLKPGGNVEVTCDWTTPVNDEYMKDLAQGLASLIYLSNTGRFIPLFQTALTQTSGSDIELDRKTAQTTLAALAFLLQKNGYPSAKDSDDPLVSPSECFSVRGMDTNADSN